MNQTPTPQERTGAAMSERVTCPGCGKGITLTKAGTFRHHRSDQPEWPGSPFNRVCAESGKDPR